MEYILGIDIGTGSTKAVALDLAFNPVDSCQKHYSSSAPLPGYSEQEPELIWQAFVWCINEMLNKMGALPLAVSLSSAMHSLVMTNEQGRALAPMMTWADARSAGIAAGLMETPEGKRIYEATGTPIHAMSPLCKLIWLGQNQTDLFDKTHKFVSIKEYIWYQLFNEYEVDHSIASCTGLFNVKKQEWDTEALLLAKVDSGRLSEPRETNYLRRGLAPSAMVLFRLHDVPFVIGASDGCLANLGSHAIEPGIAALTIGTSGAVRIAAKQPLPNPAMTFSYLLDEQTYICGGPVNNGGVVLQWLLRNVFGKQDLDNAGYDSLFELITPIPAGSEGLIFLPYLSGERAPVWDAAACGNFFGLRLHHSQGHLARAVLEGICYALNHVLVLLEQYTGPILKVKVSGGFVHSEIWMQLLSDVTGKPLVLMHTDDASAIGAAYLAVKAIGLAGEYPQPARQERVIMPDPGKHLVYRDGFKQYIQIYPALKHLM